MPQRLFPVRPFAGFSPSIGRERLVVHICKGGISDRCLDYLYPSSVQCSASLTYAWDDGTGRVLEP